MRVIEKEPVIDPEEMDDEDFCRHMTKRHRDSLGGLSDIWPVAESTTDAWRAFHNRLHRLRIDLQHEHEEGND
jgi:hypothetical protein